MMKEIRERRAFVVEDEGPSESVFWRATSRVWTRHKWEIWAAKSGQLPFSHNRQAQLVEASCRDLSPTNILKQAICPDSKEADGVLLLYDRNWPAAKFYFLHRD